MRALADLGLTDRSFCIRFLPFTITKAILFDIPVLSPGTPFPKPGDPVTVRWLRQKDGYRYHFESSVLGLVQDTEDGLPAISIAYPSSLIRTQRRQAFRVQVPLEDAQNMFLRWGTPPNDLECPAFAYDLSATGGRFSFAIPLAFSDVPDVSSVVSITISLAGKQYNVEGRIARINKVGAKEEHAEGRERWMIGVCFINQPSVFQKALENYVIRQQRQR